MFIERWGFQGSTMGKSTERRIPNEWRVPVQDRSRHRFDEIFAAASAELDEEGTPFEDVVLAMVDRYGAEVRRTPGLLSISRASLVDRDAYQLFQRALCPVRQWTAIALGHRLPGMETTRLQEVAAVIVETVQSLMFFSLQPESPTRDDVLQELRLIIRGYLNELRQEIDK